MSKIRGAVRRPRSLVLAVLAVGALLLSACYSSNQGKVLDQINADRKAAGKPAVAPNDQAMSKAQAWADHMARTGVVEHTGGGSKLDTTGLPRNCAVGENVGKGTSTEAINQAFLRSAPHKANILGNYSHVGTGVTRVGDYAYVVEIFYRAC